MREAYSAATDHVGRAVSGNLPLWIGVLAAVAVAALVLRQGTVAAVAGMVFGILVMMWSEKGFVSTHPPPAGDDDPA